MKFRYAKAASPSFRLIPSQFPPIGAFDTVATTADAEAVMELAGWTNDRLVTDRLGRLPKSDWIFGIANSSVIMASFLHIAPSGMRFNSPELGAWYAADTVKTAAVEVAHHLRREAVARRKAEMQRNYRTYSATLLGDYVDIRGAQMAVPQVYDPVRYDASQAFGEDCRAAGEAGILYDSLRYQGGTNVAAYRTRNITAVVQTDHYSIKVFSTSRQIDIAKLASAKS